MKRILITAFEPFGGESVNAVEELLKAELRIPDGVELLRLSVPTAFRRAIPTVTEAIGKFRPDAVLCLGQASGYEQIALERVAVNLMDARIPDNDSFQPVDLPVEPEGPAAYFAGLPLRAMETALREREIPVRLSYTAGTFVCNALMYGVLHERALRGDRHLCGFVHVPCLPVQAEGKSYGGMPLSVTVPALETVIAVTAAHI